MYASGKFHIAFCKLSATQQWPRALAAAPHPAENQLVLPTWIFAESPADGACQPFAWSDACCERDGTFHT